MTKRSSSTIPTNYIAVLLETVKACSVSPEQLLEGSGIQPETLNDYFHQTDLGVFIRLVEKSVELTGDPVLGLRFGRCMSLASHGMLGVAASNQSTVGDALEVLMAYSQLRVGFYYFHAREAGQNVEVELEMAPLPELFSRFMIEGFLAFLTAQIMKVDNHKASISVTYQKPANYGEYRRQLNVGVRFSQKANFIRFPRRLLQKKIKSANPSLARLALQQCSDQHDVRGQNYKSRIAHIIRSSRNKMISRELVAENLHMSGSTLNRRLAEEGTNFASLAREVRFQEACEYLEKTDKSIKEIAQLLGYGDASNFGRIFRQKTGGSASSYRERSRKK